MYTKNYSELKKVALNYDPYQLKVNLSDISIGLDGSINLCGKNVRCSNDRLPEKIANSIFAISPQLQKKFAKGNWKEGHDSLIKLVKTAQSLSSKQVALTFLAGRDSKAIFDVLPQGNEYINNRFVFSIFERMMNHRSDLIFREGGINGDGSISMNIYTKQMFDDFNIDKGKDEAIYPGFTISNCTSGLSIMQYMVRLICDNGMTKKMRNQSSFTLNKMNEKSVDKFYAHFSGLSEQNFLPDSLEGDIAKAAKTPVSFNELFEAAKTMINNSSIKSFESAELNTYLPEFADATAELARKGYDYTDSKVCTPTRLKNYPVKSASVWDVVNRLTYFGSHDLGVETEKINVQKDAGLLFGKKIYDTENLLII